MSDSPTHTISETCRCGGSISVTAASSSAARADVNRWRSGHPCTSTIEALDRGKSGGGAQLGFASRRVDVTA